MEYLRTQGVKVDGHQFQIRELSHEDYMYAKEVGENEEAFALRIVERGVMNLGGDAGKVLPPRIVGALAQHIMRLSIPEDPEGNSVSALSVASSSD